MATWFRAVSAPFRGSPEAAAFAEVSDALAALARLHPFGVEDHELVSISV